MDFQSYYRSLRGPKRNEYAERAGTPRRYIEIHLLAPPERRKTPKQPLMRALADASGGHVSFADVLAHFYGVYPDVG